MKTIFAKAAAVLAFGMAVGCTNSPAPAVVDNSDISTQAEFGIVTQKIGKGAYYIVDYKQKTFSKVIVVNEGQSTAFAYPASSVKFEEMIDANDIKVVDSLRQFLPKQKAPQLVK